MFVKILEYWRNQTLKEKIFIVALLFAIGYGLVVTVQKSIIKYQYFKQVEKEHQQLTEKIKVYEAKEQKILTKNNKSTKRTKKKVAAIDKKLKQDEKIIDNSIISDDELDRFLAKYE